QLLKYLPADLLRKADYQVAFGEETGAEALALTTNGSKVNLWFGAFRTLLGGWFLRIALLDDLADRIRSALEKPGTGEQWGADTEKFLKIHPR
ncbi:hypothetical protein, partial [Escherichia coli]|uniref:hypothetical protein n=1 Tax=Escherichia coli TaxID=562 RepID=UPI001F3A8235